jgi:hypothetical protein
MPSSASERLQSIAVLFATVLTQLTLLTAWYSFTVASILLEFTFMRFRVNAKPTL